jgi:hypothetical protein
MWVHLLVIRGQRQDRAKRVDNSRGASNNRAVQDLMEVLFEKQIALPLDPLPSRKVAESAYPIREACV